MTARSNVRGHMAVYYMGRWIYRDTRLPVSFPRACAKCNRLEAIVKVLIPATLSHTGKARWDEKAIDFCVAPLVRALTEARIFTSGSCCGHGKANGYVSLHNNRVLIIKPIEGSLSCTLNKKEERMGGKRRIIKSPHKEGSINQREIRKAVQKIKDEYIKIGRIGKMEARIHIDVEKVDNGFILFRDIYGIKLRAAAPDEGREIYVKFPEVRKRIIQLLTGIASDLEEAIAEAIPGKE